MKKVGTQMPFLVVEYKKIEKYLEKQASVGRKLEKATYSAFQGFSFDFIKTKPQEIKYCIDLTEKIDEEYLALCNDSGWQYICSTRKMNFFSATNKNVIDIQTDPEIEEQLIKKAMYHKEIFKPIVCSIVALLMALVFLFLGDNMTEMKRTIGKGIGLLYFSYGIFCLTIVGYLHHIVKERSWRTSKMIKPIIRYVYYPLPIVMIGNFLLQISLNSEESTILYIHSFLFVVYIGALLMNYIRNR